MSTRIMAHDFEKCLFVYFVKLTKFDTDVRPPNYIIYMEIELNNTEERYLGGSSTSTVYLSLYSYLK